jgi:S-adenosylmethionine-dependent methyltransferase
MSLSSLKYSEQFQQLIRQMHRGMEDRPQYASYIQAQLSGPGSRIAAFEEHLVPEIRHHFGDLENLRILDFGCGTGATTVPLAAACSQVVGLDLGASNVAICRQRLEEHGMRHRVQDLVQGDLEKIYNQLGLFDVIVVNGVIEHIPISQSGLRGRILRCLFEMLRPGGSLFIADTPNRLFPYDSHTTRLWWIPWTRPGSKRAFDKAVGKGRFIPVESYSEGPLGLEQEGAWGATYWEILSYLDKNEFEVVNLLPGHGDRVHYAMAGSWRRRLFERIFHLIAVRMLNVPLTALIPYIDNLVIRKRAAASG